MSTVITITKFYSNDVQKRSYHHGINIYSADYTWPNSWVYRSIFLYMRIQILSDLHLEFEAFECDVSQADILILAGDIHVGAKAIEWLDTLQSKVPVLYVFGNHEYYKNTYPRLIKKLKSKTEGSLCYILENNALELEGITFHGTTLWTDFELLGDPRIAGHACQTVMSDFKKIRREPNYSKLRSIDVAIIHKKSLNWLQSSLQSTNTQKNVIITHHAPSRLSIPEHRRTDIISSAYASNLEEFIISNPNISLWFHGHIHKSSDYQIGNCRIICNPRGYPDERNPDFNPHLLVEVTS